MSDWRLNGQEKYLLNATFYKISFPEFWNIAYRDKNEFYIKVEECAKNHVKKTHNGHEYLEGEKIQYFWHEHCDFCWEKAMTDIICTFYCTKDMNHWICETCFHDFKDKFKWEEKSKFDLFQK